jgi:hypothetical protein
MPRTQRELSRSVRLRKYEAVYRAHMRRNDEHKRSEKPRTPRPTRRKHRENVQERSSRRSKEKERKKKPLNEYQKFVKRESKKDKYRNMRGSERLAAIAVEWDRHKKRSAKPSRARKVR